LKAIQSGLKSAPSRGRVVLCLLIAITFLYNPFLGAASGLSGRTVSHLPSFRATVASLELLKFAPEEKQETAAAQECDVQAPIVLVPVRPETTFPVSRASEYRPLQFVPKGNLFFRPPPVV